jgi:glycerol-3-phosphate dehydrogenase
MMRRDVPGAATESYDLIAVGGGIYGAMLVMEAARRGLRPLLLERDDFGGATSWNSLRILHGGLRYLQTMDLTRFRESVFERRWFCRTYPDLVEPLRCLMPLYGRGLKRPSTFRVALWMNDLLSRGRNEGVPEERRLPNGRVIDPAETRSLFPMVAGEGLRGAGLWYDAVMTSTARVLMETLRWACHNGATALNYVECVGLLADGAVVEGVQAVDRVAGTTVELRAPLVINCTGPWSRALASRLDRELDDLFRPSLAFNVLLRRPPLSEAALAVTPERPGARTYFLRSWGDRVFAGTFHAPCSGYPSPAVPTERQLLMFLSDINDAVPGWELTRDDVVRVYSGLLPARRRGSDELAVRPTVVDHATTGGPDGLWSVSGVKYTTSRLVAEQTLRRCFASSGRDLRIRPDSERPAPVTGPADAFPTSPTVGDTEETKRLVGAIVEEEAVTCMDDLLSRRTDWGIDPEDIDSVAAGVTELLGWRLPSRNVESRTDPHPAS